MRGYLIKLLNYYDDQKKKYKSLRRTRQKRLVNMKNFTFYHQNTLFHHHHSHYLINIFSFIYQINFKILTTFESNIIWYCSCVFIQIFSQWRIKIGNKKKTINEFINQMLKNFVCITSHTNSQLLRNKMNKIHYVDWL